MVCLGLEHGAAGWRALTNPLSYGGTHTYIYLPYLPMPTYMYVSFLPI